MHIRSLTGHIARYLPLYFLLCTQDAESGSFQMIWGISDLFLFVVCAKVVQDLTHNYCGTDTDHDQGCFCPGRGVKSQKFEL